MRRLSPHPGSRPRRALPPIRVADRVPDPGALVLVRDDGEDDGAYAARAELYASLFGRDRVVALDPGSP